MLENQLDKLDLLPGEKTRGDQRIFKRIKHNRPTAEEGFFHKQDLGVNYFDSIVRTVGDYTGLALNPQQRQNMALRTTTFSLHDAVEIPPDVTASIAGHSNEKTQRIYKRKNHLKSAKANAAVLTDLTGIEHTVKEDNRVRLLDGSVVEVNVDDFFKENKITMMDLPELGDST